MGQFKWIDEYAPGRVFELRSASKLRDAPCVLILTDSDDPGIGLSRCSIQVDQRGAEHIWTPSDRGGLPRRAADRNLWRFGRRDMTSANVKRRRRDLERFDAADLSLLSYGLDIDFTGRVGRSPYSVSLPLVAGVRWTIFSAPNWYGRIGQREREREAMALLHGAWHLHAFGGNRWEAYATAHTDQRRLAAFERLYRDMTGRVIRCETEIVQEQRGDTLLTYGRGQTGPVIRRGGTSYKRPTGVGVVWSSR